MKKISVIIPTYKAVEYLELCLYSLSLIEEQEYIEVIVICDGYYDLHKETLDKYSKVIDIKVIKFETNLGIVTAINYGVYATTSENILVINDDNVLPKHLIKHLNEFSNYLEGNYCISFPQVEPTPSIFHINFCHDFGKTFDTFDIQKFDEKRVNSSNIVRKHLGTFPFIINKKLFMTVGGFSDEFRSKAGFVSDWDFFIKVSNIIELKYFNSCHFYHFAHISSKDRSVEEMHAHHFFKFKYGKYGSINEEQTSYLN